MKADLEQSPPYAPAQAFVVQFGRETAVDTGRVEHTVTCGPLGCRSAGRIAALMAALPV